MKDLSRYSDHDSHRTRLLVLLPKEEIPAECLQLLAELLTTAPSVSFKGRYQSLASLSFSFEPIHFLSRNAILVYQDQVEDHSLSYLFKDPYKEADSLLLEILSKGPLHDEKRLDQAKRNLLLKSANPAELLASALGLPLSPIAVDRKKLSGLSYNDIEKAVSVLAGAEVALALYDGSPKRDYPLPLPRTSGTEELLPGTGLVLDGTSQGEALALVLSHPVLSSQEDLFSFYSAYLTFQRTCSLFFRRMMLSDIEYSLFPATGEKSVVMLRFASDNLSLLRKQLPFRKGENLPFLYDRARGDDQLLKKKELELLVDRKARLSWLLVSSLLSLDDSGLLEEHKAEKAKDFYEATKIADIVFATGGRK